MTRLADEVRVVNLEQALQDIITFAEIDRPKWPENERWRSDCIIARARLALSGLLENRESEVEA